VFNILTDGLSFVNRNRKFQSYGSFQGFTLARRSGLQKIWKVMLSRNGTNQLIGEYSPPVRSLGISDLGHFCDLIYGAQSLAGKILSRKGLQSQCFGTRFQNGTIPDSGAVVASTMIAQSEVWAQGRASHRSCGKRQPEPLLPPKLLPKPRFSAVDLRMCIIRSVT
jgi:hypothetical protein